MEEKLKCVVCEEELAEDRNFEVIGDGDVIDPTGKRDGEVICGSCIDAFQYYGNALCVVQQGKRVRLLYDDGLILDTDEHFYELPEEIQQVIAAIVTGTTWRRTDPWRGYETGPKEAAEWVRALDGWHSSLESSPLSEAINAIIEGKTKLPYPLVIGFLRTSNVCSIGLSVWSRSQDADRIREHLGRLRAAPTYAGF